MTRVAVIGGGLSGLTAAHRLSEHGVEAKLFEAGPRVGGILGTVEREGFVIETGPDSILSEKRSAVELAERIGIGDRVISTNTANRGAYVVHRGKLVRVPGGFSLIAPTRWDAWAKTDVVGWRGKLRAAIEPLLPAKRDLEDESMASFVRRRLGPEVFDRLAQPLVGGIYGGDPDRLSLEATMPRFVEMERTYGSVIRGMLAKQRRASERAASGARYGLFVSFDGGMRVLIDALAARVDAQVGCPIESIERTSTGWTVAGESFDRIIIALPAWRAAHLVEPHHRGLADALLAIPYGSAATVTYAWPREAIPHSLDAFGFVVPAVEQRPILAATFSSVKWPGRAPDGQVLLRVFIGGAHAPDAAELDDETLDAMARRELSRLIGVEAAPRFTIRVRYARAMPQYQVGHRARVAAIEALQGELPGLRLAGNAYRGVGIPDTILYAETVADDIADDVADDVAG